jgi:four helix bundle protein
MKDDAKRPPAKTFEDLVVWQKSHAFVLRIYELTATFPRAESYSLTAQLRRAVVSIPANVAEGFKKRGRADKARFMNIAQGSLEEARYYLILGRDLGYYQDKAIVDQLEEVSRLLEGYTRAVLQDV